MSTAPQTEKKEKRLSSNTFTALICAGVFCAMVGLSFAAVPLYNIFCRVTGYGGTTQVASAAPHEVIDRVVTVRFDGNVARDMPWSFHPVQTTMDVKIGETALAYFRATNNTSETIKGTASFNVTPDKAGSYFSKIECFCFTEQVLAPGESVDMPVTFFVDPDMARDHNLDKVGTITLSYTFFRVEDGEA